MVNRVKEKDKKPGKKVGSILAIAFLILYLPSLFHWIYGDSIETDVLRFGTIEDIINTDAVIIRDETVLKSPFSGKCITEIGEGEKVASNSVVASILKDSSLALVDELEKKDLEILNARKEKNKNKEVFSEDIYKIENEIKYKVEQAVKVRNNLVYTKQVREEIDGLIQKKASIFGKNSSSDSYIDNLVRERDLIQQKISSNTKNLYSTGSGIVSYNLDGYEDILKISGIRNLSVKDIEEIKIDNGGSSNRILDIQIDKPFAKIIKDFEANLVFVLEEGMYERYKVDDFIQEIRISQLGKTINGTVDYKSNTEDGKFITAIKVDKGISETSGLRKINVDIIKNSYNGLKVPLKSLMEIDETEMKAKIVLSKGNYASIREVKIKGRDDEFAIIESLAQPGISGVSLYDTYVLNPLNIKEGQVIN